MTGKPGRKKREWDTYDKVLQHLFGVDTYDMEHCHPIFGSSIRCLLTTSHAHDDIKITQNGNKVVIEGKHKEILQPTFLNLAYHFMKLEWAEENINSLVRKSNDRIAERDIDVRFMKAAKQAAAREFNEERVIPLRKELLKHGLYFYCLPSVSLELDETTGSPVVIDGDEVLCVLPMSVAIAKKYGLSDEEIMLLAPQVLWLIKNLCGTGVIKTQQQLNDAFDDWGRYISLPIQKHIIGLIEQTRPDLADEA